MIVWLSWIAISSPFGCTCHSGLTCHSGRTGRLGTLVRSVVEPHRGLAEEVRSQGQRALKLLEQGLAGYG